MTQTKWTLETLNKAYQQGYMNGLADKSEEPCPYQNDVLIAAWEAGLDDGYDQMLKARQSHRQDIA